MRPGVRLTVLPHEKATSGTPLGLDGRIMSFSYEDCEEKSDKVTLDLDNHDLALFEREELLGGSVLEVSWGYGYVMAPPRRVVIKELKGFETLRVEGHAVSVLMDQEVRTRRWEHATRADVVRAVAAEHGLPVEVEETGERFETICQSGESDAGLLRRLAGRERFSFYVDHTGLHWHRPRRGEAPLRVFTWRGGRDILSLNVESNLLLRTGAVEVRARDPKEKVTKTGAHTSETAKRETLADVLEVVDPERGTTSMVLLRNATKSTRAGAAGNQADKEAEGRFAESEREAVKLTMKIVGDPLVVAKTVVEVRGISPLLSGKYYVKEVTHAIAGDGYTCDLKLTKDGISRRASEASVPQGGEKNRAESGDGRRVVERVDKESGATAFEFRAGKSSDPEARR